MSAWSKKIMNSMWHFNLSKGYNKIIIPTNLMNVFKMYLTKSVSVFIFCAIFCFTQIPDLERNLYFKKENLVSIIDKKKSLKNRH